MLHHTTCVTREDLAEEVALRLHGITRSLRSLRDLSKDDTSRGVRSAHLLLLLIEHHGALRAADLVRLTSTDRSTMSRHVARLVDEGFLIRKSGQSDGRVSLLELTRSGKQMCNRLRRQRRDLFLRTLGDWSQQDIELFVKFLSRFNTAFRSEVGLPGSIEEEEQ